MAQQQAKQNTFFTIARFEPDSILIYSILVAMTLILYFLGFYYFALMPLVTLGVIFAVESSETIYLDYPPQKELLGAKCIILKEVAKGEKGVVKLCDSQGKPSWELWSAESTLTLKEGTMAVVMGVREGLVLQIRPLMDFG